MSSINPKDASDLYIFALDIGATGFAHMVTAAGQGEVWAVTRVQRVIDQINNCELNRRDAVLAADTNRPDGAIARAAFKP